MHRLLHMLIICVAMGSLGRSGDAPAKGRSPKAFRVVGYLPTYRMKAVQKSWAKYVTDIIYFSIEPKVSGEVDTSKLNAEHLKQIQALAKDKKIRVSICVGGWGRSNNFAAVATNVQRRRKFIAELLALCKKHKFAGVDFDWEFPRGKDQEQGYTDLLVETRAAFKPHKLLVTVAVGSGHRLRKEAYQAVDFVHLMSYDHGGRHATYEQSVADVKRHLAFGVPREKLCLGVPFYGRKIKNRNDAKAYSEIVRSHRPATSADEAGGYYFNGIDTIRKKTRHALKSKLAGIMIWELGQDTVDGSSLLQAIGKTIREDWMIVAHRGASKDAPGNTIPAFKRAWEQGADAIEGDFHLTKDGQIVCIHNADTKAVTGKKLIVASSTLEELQRLDMGSRKGVKFKGTAIPTIAEVFATIPAGKKIYIEIKCGVRIIPPLLNEIEKSGLKAEQVVVISFSTDVIREIKKKAPQLKANWLCSIKKDKAGTFKPTVESVLKTLKEIGADGLSSSKNVVNEKYIRRVMDAGYGYHVWTVDDVATAKRFFQWGAGSVTTNVPGEIRKGL